MAKQQLTADLAADMYRNLFSAWAERPIKDISEMLRVGDPFKPPQPKTSTDIPVCEGFQRLKEHIDRHFSPNERANLMEVIDGLFVSLGNQYITSDANQLKVRDSLAPIPAMRLNVQSHYLEDLPDGHKAELNRFLQAVAGNVCLGPVEVFLYGPMADGHYVPGGRLNVAVISDLFTDPNLRAREDILRKVDPDPYLHVFPLGLTSREFSSVSNAKVRIAWRH